MAKQAVLAQFCSVPAGADGSPGESITFPHGSPAAGTAPNTAEDDGGLHRTDCAMKTKSTSSTCLSSPPGRPHPPHSPAEGARRAARTRTAAGPPTALPRGRTHHHLLEDALQLGLHGHHGDRHGAGPGPAGPFVRRRRRRPPRLARSAGRAVPDGAPREAPAPHGRSGCARSRLPATGRGKQQRLKTWERLGFGFLFMKIFA